MLLLLFMSGCGRDDAFPDGGGTGFVKPLDLGSADGFTMNFRIAGDADETITIPTGIPSANGFAAAVRVRQAAAGDPDRFSERVFDRGPDAHCERFWIDGQGCQWLLLRRRDPASQRERFILERIDPRSGEAREHLLAQDKSITVHDLVRDPAGEEFLLLRGNFLSEHEHSMAMQPLSGSLPATLEPRLLPFRGEPNLWMRHCGHTPDGAMILVWSIGQQWSGGAVSLYGTKIACSRDGGRSWSEPHDLPPLPELEVPLAFLLSHEGTGTMHLFVATQHYANAEGRFDQHLLKSLLHFSSADNGASWLQNAITLPPAPSGAFFRAIAIDAAGTLNVLWAAERTVYLVRSPDRGAAWSSWLPLNLPADWLEDFCYMALGAVGDVYLCIRAHHPGSENTKNILFSHARFAGE